jgi:hypothetical protein
MLKIAPEKIAEPLQIIFNRTLFSGLIFEWNLQFH